jgi:uncharacterized tellurite resistance protein B-like protein
MDTQQTQDDESGLSPLMALCLAAITLVGIDGEFKEEELEKLRSFIHADETAFLKAFNFYTERPLDVCIKVVTARLNDQQKRTTYLALYDLAHVDQEFAEAEQNLLQQYASVFGLSDEFVKSVTASTNHQYDLTVFD